MSTNEVQRVDDNIDSFAMVQNLAFRCKVKSGLQSLPSRKIRW